MLDIKAIRLNKEIIEENLNRRGKFISLDSILVLDKKKREKLQLIEDKNSFKNKISKEIGNLKNQGKDVSNIMRKVAFIGDEISKIGIQIKAISDELRNSLFMLPNLLDVSVPIGKNNKENQEVRRIGELKKFPFKPKAHYNIGTDLDILDFERGTKTSGSRFVFMKGLGAKLERALINFMIDTHVNKGYKEVWSPFLVSEQSLIGTSQLPKFSEDMFKIENRDLYLIPTGDVPLTVFQSINVDGIIVVTSPQDLVSMIVGKAVNMAKNMNIPILGLVENMSYVICHNCEKKIKIFGESKLKENANKYNIELVGKIPLDSQISAACDLGEIEKLRSHWLDHFAPILKTI